MKLTPILGITAVMFILSACSIGPRKVSMAEATASYNQITTDTSTQPTSPPQLEKIYTQPVNKTEPCKLPTSKEQLERRNFRAYWDGDCKDGYAYGFGRDIALSDTHHFEEITIHNGDGYSNGRPFRFLDYVQNYGRYGIHKDAASGLFSGQNEIIKNDSANFFISYRVGTWDNKSNGQYMYSSPFRSYKVTTNQPHERIAYKMEDHSARPATSTQAQIRFLVEDPTTGKPLDFQILRFNSGVVQHHKLTADGQSFAELVQLPQEYIDQLQGKIDEAQVVIQKAKEDAAKAQQMEREYLYMACAADYSIKGVPPKDMEIARQICTWRDQWKEPYARAEAKYKQEIEQKRLEVVQAEKQRSYIAAQQAQAAAAQSAAFSASMNQMNQGLQQQNNNTLQQINQMNQQIQQQNNQMMESLSPQQNKTTTCNLIGNQILCR